MLTRYGKACVLPALVLAGLALCEALIITVLLPRPAASHEAAPSEVTVEHLEDTLISIRATFDLANDHAPTEARPARAKSARPVPSHILTMQASGAQLVLRKRGARAANGPKRIVEYTANVPDHTPEILITPAPELGDTLVRYTDRFGQKTVRYVTAGTSATLPWASQQAPVWVVAVDYTIAGFDHIVPKGLDHILFVVGLFLLTLRLRPLLLQVSLFTVAHTMTLALGSIGVIAVPAVVVEPLIAASIVFIAVENMTTRDLSRWRPLVVFGFGLLHGLGFARVLADFGLPQDQFLTALLAFNIGVELGQLFVLAVCFVFLGYWCAHKAWYRARVSLPASLFVGLVGAFWTIERLGSVL